MDRAHPAVHQCLLRPLQRLNRAEIGPMSVLLAKTAEQQRQARIRLDFHLLMTCVCSVVLLLTLLACKLASLRIPNPLGLLAALAFACAVVFVVAIFWHEKGKMDLRDATLTIPWVFFLAATLPLLVL